MTMRKLSIVAWLMAALLTGCGGETITNQTGSSSSSSSSGSSSSSSSSSGGGTETIAVTTSLPQIASDGSQKATITALVRDANNNFVPGVVVAFTATSGGLAVTQPSTDANGSALATLTSAGDPTNRTITVTANTDGVSATVPVTVAGTTITLTGPSTLVSPATGTYSVALLNSGSVGVSGATVTLTSANKNTLSGTSVVTDSTGHATFTVTAANSGADTITATALGISATESVTVSNQSFAFSAPADNTNINLGVSQTVTVKWTAGGVAVAGQTVTFASTRGTLSSATATTDGTGSASVSISSTSSGAATITATATGVSAAVGVDFIATTAASLNLQASPATIATQAQSTVTAVVRDANNNLVEGKTVDFSLSDVTGGTLSVASALTNSQGVASTVYTASSSTSATNGVSVRASIPGTSVSGTTTITVAGRAVFLSMGTGNTISAYSATQYQIPYSVQAIDNAGNSVANVTLSISATSISYVKGERTNPSGNSWVVQPSTPQPCPTEDLPPRNGILDPGEDVNGNGKLDPGAVASVSPGTLTTDANGSYAFNLIYPKDHAEYVTITLTAVAAVQGTESSTSATFLLPALASDVNIAATALPVGPISPYGIATACSDPN